MATSDAMLSAAGLLVARATLERWLAQTRVSGSPGVGARDQFHAIWEQVSEQLLPVIEGAGLDEEDQVAAVRAAVQAIEGAKLQPWMLGPHTTAVQLSRQLASGNLEQEPELSPRATALYDTILLEWSRCMLAGGEDGDQPPDPAGRHPAIVLLDEWLADESGYDEETWPKVKEALDKDRLGYRKLFDE